ncbi:response regulator transcription factor [Nocardia sp. NEAU-G5]|uniref:Response regulator transcription factor n=1 Tax=Nocardia albiluteola TaxID=2842303 RepID=A0ABS6AX73_9NOCA|nr:response regulator transcription factor [Nocardia albiluteola]MBU3062483.1 response regulator transcription factor [Nocardia albiluteola]MBU3065683.1 response regulator transcription factor [Nocardia albiluteola]
MTEPGTEIRVLVADDQQVMREGLVALLGLVDGVRVVGAVGNGEEAVRAVAELTPEVVLMDLRMPVLDGVAATRRITTEHPGTGVIVLTTYSDDASIAGALRAGARGYLTKDAGRTEIAAAIRAAAAGQSSFDATVLQRLVAALSPPTPPTPQAPSAHGPRSDGESAGENPSPATPKPRTPRPDGLTAREAEVIGLIGQGLSNAEIAGALYISETTVKTHINNVFAKIGARNRADAVRYAYRHGLAQP